MNNPVQNNSLYQKIIGTLLPKGLKSNARANAIDDVAKKFEKQARMVQVFSGADDYNQAKEVMRKTAGTSSKKIKGTPDEINKIREIAITRGANISVNVMNADEALQFYDKALGATKRKIGTQTAINMANDYFVSPYANGNIKTGLARTGTALGIGAGVVGAGVGVSKLLSADDNSYYDNLNSYNNNGIQNY